MKTIIKSITFFAVMTVSFPLSSCMSMETNNVPATLNSVLLNPERGWYCPFYTEDVSEDELAGLKTLGITLVLFETNLESYLSKPLDSLKLIEIDRAFAAARKAGVSVIFRAAYDYDGKSKPEPADIGIILGHIKQLGPVFHKNEDILFNVQAGFLGPWGEWHNSRYGDPIESEYQRMVAEALLEAVPESVTVAVRRPEYIRTIAGPQILTRAEAFGNSKIARLAFHNDALMADASDMGTYDPSMRSAELEWVNNHTRYTPMIGETNKVSRYNDSENAIEYCDQVNMQSMNMEYHPKVLDKWQKAKHGGMNAYDYIGMMMGYRFVLNRVNISESAMYGLRLELEITNVGFGNLLKEKKLALVLKKDSQTYRAAIAEDARFWNKNEPINRDYYFSLPADMASGEWDVYLALSSGFNSLAGKPAYSVRFANADFWDAELGLNKIGTVNLTSGGNSQNSEEMLQISP